MADPEELLGPPCPAGAGYLLAWFGELAAARSSSGFGANPIGFTEIDAWARLTGRELALFDVQALRRIDDVFLAAVRAARDESKKG